MSKGSSPPKKLTKPSTAPLTKLANELITPAPAPTAIEAIPLAQYAIASALFLIFSLSKSNFPKFSIFLRVFSIPPPKNVAMPSIKPPSAAKIDPVPINDNPAPKAANPIPTFLRLSPFTSLKDLSPSAIVGRALPIIQVAPAIPAPIIAIDPDNILAPSKI